MRFSVIISTLDPMTSLLRHLRSLDSHRRILRAILDASVALGWPNLSVRHMDVDLTQNQGHLETLLTVATPIIRTVSGI